MPKSWGFGFLTQYVSVGVWGCTWVLGFSWPPCLGLYVGLEGGCFMTGLGGMGAQHKGSST